jgi:hypothetical protein
LYARLEEIERAVEDGSVITVDAGIKTLAAVAAHNVEYNLRIFPDLIHRLEKCRPKDVARYAENIFVAVNAQNKAEYAWVLNQRMEDLSGSQSTRVRKLIRQIE